MGQANYQIIVADDEPFARATLVKILEKFGFESIVACANGGAAWAAIEGALREESPIALVISDWRMPDIDGLKLLTRIRRHEKTHDLPFVLLTGIQEVDQVQEAVQLGVSDYIVKPPTADVLKKKLERLLKITLPLSAKT